MNQFPTHVVMQQRDSLKESFAPLQRMPGISVVKNLRSQCIVVSDYLAHLTGWGNSGHCEEQTDYDIQCEAVNVADMFVQYDKKVIQKKHEILTLDICEYAPGWKTLLSSKKPIQNINGKVTGVFAQAIDISNTNMFKWCLSLITADCCITGKENLQRIYALNNEHLPLPLTPKQQSFLFLLVRGKSTKEIASVLGISVRTAEEHVSTIKTKLNCNSRSQVIEKAISNGFLNFIPQDMLYRQFAF